MLSCAKTRFSGNNHFYLHGIFAGKSLKPDFYTQKGKCKCVGFSSREQNVWSSSTLKDWRGDKRVRNPLEDPVQGVEDFGKPGFAKERATLVELTGHHQ